ncbi:MAG: hypothetical protein WC605_04255 [Bacteroidales bacterium]
MFYTKSYTRKMRTLGKGCYCRDIKSRFDSWWGYKIRISPD